MQKLRLQILSGFVSFVLGLAWQASATAATNLVYSGVYVNSEGSPLIALVEQATQTIDIEVYEMFNLNLRHALRRALARGVRIRIVHEPFPVRTQCPLFLPPAERQTASCRDVRRLMGEVVQAGGAVVAFHKLNLCANLTERDLTDPEGPRCFGHGKMMIVDGIVAMISTGNFNDSSLCDLSANPLKCNRDYSVVSADPEVVDTFARIFEYDLAEAPYTIGDLLTPSVRTKVTVSPLTLEPLLQFIHSARKSIRIQNQYLKEFKLNGALIAAARRGVKVLVNVASFCSFGPPQDYDREAATKTYTLFDQAGIQTWTFTEKIQINGMPGYLHAKAIVVDDQRAWIGSANGSVPGMSKNREFGLFIDDPQSVAGLAALMKADMKHPEGQSWQDSLNCVKETATAP